MTEDEAKAKWCPMARVAFQYRADPGNGDRTIVVNRTENDSAMGQCIGSACMMWRVQAVIKFDPMRTDNGTPQGYCGLGGAP